MKISYIYDLVDKISPQLQKIQNNLKKIEDISVGISVRATTAFDKLRNSLISVGNSAQQMGGKMLKVGKDIGAKVSIPTAIFAANALRLYDDAVLKQKSLEFAIQRQTKNIGFSLGELQGMADDFQKNTTLDADDIIGEITTPLVRMGVVAGDSFAKAQSVIIDMAAAMKIAGTGGENLAQVTTMFGKALNDPATAVAKLQRAGIILQKSDAARIKQLADMGKGTEAQTALLDALQKQVGGTAAQMSKLGLGAEKQLYVAIGDLNEAIGEGLNELLHPLVIFLRDLTNSIKNLSPSMKHWVAIITVGIIALPKLITGLAALLIVFGKATTIVGALRIALMGLFKWFTIAGVIFGVISLFIDWGDAIDRATRLLKGFWEDLKTVGNFAAEAFSSVREMFGGEKIEMQVEPKITGDPRAEMQAMMSMKPQQQNFAGNLDININGMPKGSNTAFTFSKPSNFNVGVNPIMAR